MNGQIIPFKDQLQDEWMELQLRPDLANEEIELFFVIVDCNEREEALRLKIHWESVIVITQTLGKMTTDFEFALKRQQEKSEENDA